MISTTIQNLFYFFFRMKELAVFHFPFFDIYIFFFPISLTPAHLWRQMMRHKTEVQKE